MKRRRRKHSVNRVGKDKSQVSLNPWAKVNLYLRVLNRRSDGYHDILTLIHPIKLFDELKINRLKEGLIINCRTEGLPNQQSLPELKDNLIYKAAMLFFEKIGRKPSVKIELVKRIPIGGGLGGGSSDAACTLRGLNKLYGNVLSKAILNDLCAETGMDTAFFLEKKPAICSGRGEIIEKRCGSKEFYCVLVNPGKALSTKEVYKALNLRLLKNPMSTDWPTRSLVETIVSPRDETVEKKNFFNNLNFGLTETETGDNISYFQNNKIREQIEEFINIKKYNEIVKYIYNDLEASAISLYPEIQEILGFLKKAGSDRGFVCGSGATVCGLTKNRRHAEEVMEKIITKGSADWWVRVVPSL